jgi:hypothetical protein
MVRGGWENGLMSGIMGIMLERGYDFDLSMGWVCIFIGIFVIFGHLLFIKY